MSHAATEWAIEADCPTPHSKLILILLADCHNKHNGDCFPWIRTLIHQSGLKETAVKDAIKALEGAGLVKRKPLYHPNGRTMGVQYDLLGVAVTTPPGGRRDDPEGSPSRPHGVAVTTPSKDNQNNNQKTNHTLSADADGVPEEYPLDFERLWREVPKPSEDPQANPGSKAKAYAAWKKLKKAEQDACWLGWQDYLEVMDERRKKRPDYPIKQLVAWISGREWETYRKDAA